MNAAPVYARWLLDSGRSLIGWAAGLTLIVFLYLPLYASMVESDLLGAKLQSLPPDMLEGLGMDALTMATPAGYAHQTVFAMLGMLVLLCCAIGQGTRAIAGDEEAGSLELTLAHATSRRAVLSARIGAVTTILVLLAALVGGLVAAINDSSGLHLPVGDIGAETAALALLVLFHGLLALALGALTGRRAWALWGATGIALLGWFAHNMGAKVADWVPALSPFEWAYGSLPLANGVDGGGLARLAVGCLVLIAAAFVGFTRRDLHS